MNALRALITEQMDGRGWKPAQLARASGLSPQLIHTLLTDDREVIDAMPKRETLAGLARAFGLGEAVLLRAAAQAWGVPVDGTVEAGAGGLSNADLIAELEQRLDAKRPRRETVLRAAREPEQPPRRRPRGGRRG